MKRHLLSLLAASVIACTAFSAPVQTALGSQSVTADAATTVSAPKASKVSGAYYSTGSLKISLKTATSGADIYYSVNGSSYKKYYSEFYITKKSTVKCYAVKNGVKSGYKTYTYSLLPKFTLSVDEGSYKKPQTVYISGKVSGVKYYYTLDGTKPTKNSALYTAKGISINETSTLRIMTAKTGWKTRYITKKYVIEKSPAVSADELSILDDYTSKWGYNQLSAAQKQGYAALFEAAKSQAKSADVSGLGLRTSDIEKMYWAFDYDNPQFFWMENGYSYIYNSRGVISIDITYGRSASEAAEIKKKFDNASEEIIAEALEYSSTSDRIKVIHDAVVNMTEYTISGPAYKSEADGPIVYGKALCEGYSKAFAYLCQSIGIDCVCISGKGDGVGHMWNMVKVDGNWYHIDVTWDDPISSTGEPMLTYDYYLVSEKKILEDHSIDNVFAVPTAPKSFS